MAKKRLSVEQNIGKLREAEILMAQRQTIPHASRVGSQHCDGLHR